MVVKEARKQKAHEEAMALASGVPVLGRRQAEAQARGLERV